jgi:hypothetical protein
MKAAEAIQTLRSVLQGTHPLDETILGSLTCLEKQLETLKKTNPLFGAITFSEEVKQLIDQAALAAAH